MPVMLFFLLGLVVRAGPIPPVVAPPGPLEEGGRDRERDREVGWSGGWVVGDGVWRGKLLW